MSPEAKAAKEEYVRDHYGTCALEDVVCRCLVAGHDMEHCRHWRPVEGENFDLIMRYMEENYVEGTG